MGNKRLFLVFTILACLLTGGSSVRAQTLSSAPYASITETSLTAGWNSTFSTGTLYYSQLSSGAFPNSFSGNQSSNTFNLSASFSGLSAATTYYAQVSTNPAGPFTSLGSKPTLGIVPAAFTTVNRDYLTVNWAATYSSGTAYYAQLSTGAFPNAFSGNQSSTTLNASVPFAGLDAGTAYFAQVGTAPAGPFTTIGSTVTAAAAALTAAPFSAVTVASLDLNWTSTFSTGTVYYFDLSTGAFPNGFAGNQSAATANLTASLSSLSGGTTYYAQVSTDLAGPYTDLGSTATLPASTIIPAQFSAVGATSLTANWNTTFPGGTTYYATLSSGTFPNAFAANQLVTTLALSASYAGLSASTTYFAEVSTVPAGPFTVLGSTMTPAPLPPVPGAPGTAVPVVLSTTSIGWTWGAGSNASDYKVYDATPTPVQVGTAAAASFTQTGLSPNTPHRLIAQGFNLSGGGPLSPNPATAYTFANPPSGTAASAIASTAALISWQLNSNTTGTVAELQRSSDAVAYSTLFSGGATQFAAGGMLGCTTYYARVRNQNFAGINTAFGSTISFVTANTTPSPPSGLSASSLSGNQVALSWTGSPTEGITQYRVFYDAGTGTVDYLSPLAILSSAQTSFTTPVLTSSASFTFAVRATHRCGVTETTGVLAQAASAGTLSALRAAVASPGAGQHVAGNSVTVAASLVSGTPDQVRQITFQYRVSGSTGWLNLPAADSGHPNPATDSLYIHWNVTGAAPGSYDLRAVAVSLSGSSDTAPGAITAVVDPITPDITESLVGDVVQKIQILDNAVSNSFSAGGAGADDPICSVTLPAGSLSVTTVTVTVVSNPEITTAAPAGMSYVGSAVQIDLGNGQHALSGGALATITLSYPEDTTAFPSTFHIYSLDPATGLWTKDFESTVNIASRTVTGMTPHFSVFAIIAGNPAAPDLDTIRVYPNPYKPNGGIPDEGKPFSAGDPTSGIVFDNLPGIVTITIYTASGRRGGRVDSSDGSGALHWDGKNDDGRDVASGGYLAVISSPGIKKTVVRKLAIIR